LTNKCFHLNMLLVYLDFLRYSGVDHSLNHLKPSMLYWKIIKEKRKDLEAHLFHVSQACSCMGLEYPNEELDYHVR